MVVNLGFDKDRLAGLIERVSTDPDVGKTVWKACTRWEHGFRSEATIRGHAIPMDEPLQLGGGDTAPNMVEVVLGAYGCCLTTGFVAQAGMQGIELEGVDIELSGDLDLQCFLGLQSPKNLSPGYTEVRATIKLTAPGATEEQLRTLYETVVASSPVGGIIERPVSVKAELVRT